MTPSPLESKLQDLERLAKAAMDGFAFDPTAFVSVAASIRTALQDERGRARDHQRALDDLFFVRESLADDSDAFPHCDRLFKHIKSQSPPGEAQGWLPIELCPTDGVWRLCKMPDGTEVQASFDGIGLLCRKRWQTKTFAYHNPSRPLPNFGGVRQMSEPYDTFLIADLPEGIRPTHFRPNDTVYGLPKVPAPPLPTDTEG